MYPAAPATSATANTTRTTTPALLTTRAAPETASDGSATRRDLHTRQASTVTPASISSRKICCSRTGTTEARCRTRSARKKRPST